VDNACGIHVHVGGDCENASTIGGHYYKQDVIAPDPWKPIMYSAEGGKASGVTIKVVTGVTSEDVAGRTMVVHDASGARIACGAIPDPWSEGNGTADEGSNSSKGSNVSLIDGASSVTFAASPLLLALVMAFLR